MIELDKVGVWVQDLGSLNGTLINGERIGQRIEHSEDDATLVQSSRQLLNDGDELRICNNIFAVVLTDSEVPVTPKLVRRKAGSSSQWEMALCV